jgi:mitochondrial inner membrane protease ATP23
MMGASLAAAQEPQTAQTNQQQRQQQPQPPVKVALKRHEKCCSQVQTLLTSDPHIDHLLRSAEARGCSLPGDFFRCVPCGYADEYSKTTKNSTTQNTGATTEDGGRNGVASGASFDPAVGVSLCEDRMSHSSAAKSALLHELVHTFDYCRARIDFETPEHVACTEIRASNLSGECGFARELLTRANFGTRKHHQVGFPPSSSFFFSLHLCALCARFLGCL